MKQRGCMKPLIVNLYRRVSRNSTEAFVRERLHLYNDVRCSQVLVVDHSS